MKFYNVSYSIPNDSKKIQVHKLASIEADRKPDDNCTSTEHSKEFSEWFDSDADARKYQSMLIYFSDFFKYQKGYFNFGGGLND